MALLKDAKEIQIPDTRYKRLEYIHFSGAEYINTNKTLRGPNTYKRATMKVSFQDVNRWSYCGYIGNNSNFVFGTRPTNLATFSLGAASYGANAYALSTNTIYQYDLWVNNANNNNLTIYDESGTTLWTSSALSATWSANTGNLYIGACYDARSSGPSGYMIANIYSFIVRQPSYGIIIYNGIPCQRKSDGVCGLFDTISGVFRAMEGTAVTDAAAGPIIEENMLIGVKKIEDANNTVLWEPLTLYEDYYLTSYSSTKNSNYIDLGIKWNSKYKVEGAYMVPVSSSEQNYGRMFGTGWNTANEIQLDYQGSGYNLRALVGNQFSRNATGTSTINTKYQFAYGDRGSSKSALWVKTPSQDWARQGAEWDTGDKISSYNIGVFTCTQGDRDGKYSINYLQINGPESLWNPDDAIMYLVPAKRGDTYGLYDKNHSKFYPGIVANDGQFKITDVNGNQIA